MALQDPLEPLDAVEIDGTVIVVDWRRPVAALVRASGTRIVTWADAVLPPDAPSASVLPASDGVWVVYEQDADSEEFTVVRTAVHIGLDGTWSGADLGQRAVAGVDEGGIWACDPRDPTLWDGIDRGSVPSIEPPDVDALPASRFDEPFWDDDDHEGPSAGDIATPVRRIPIGLVIEAGEEADWSIAFDDADPTPSGPPTTPVPTPPTELVRFGTDGTRTVVAVDHLADGVVRVGDVLRVRVHRTGPRWVVDDDGFGEDPVYEPVIVEVDCRDGVPARIDSEALPVTASSPRDPWFSAVFGATGAEIDLDDADDAAEARARPWIGRIELAGVVGTSWRPATIADDAADEAVERLRAMFRTLDTPVATWVRGSDSWERVPSDYRDVEVVIEGAWPITEVVVSFEHRSVRDLRLRRRFRVFDDSGRPINHRYADVYLEEDIETRHLPPRDRAVDGVLDI